MFFCFNLANYNILSFPNFLTKSSNNIGVYSSILIVGLHAFLFAPLPHSILTPFSK